MLSLNNPRFGLIQSYFSPTRDFSFSPADLLRGVIKLPCTRIGPRYVESIAEVDNYLAVKVRSLDVPLYWPKALPLFDLYKVLSESFDPQDWHFYEVAETQVSPGDVVLDCGAAEGMFSLRVLARAGRIIDFEPLPLFADSLRQTFAGSPQVIVVAAALGSSEGNGFLDGNSLYGQVSETGGGIPIQITTIDTWLRHAGISQVDFIKGDLESFEFEVLKGAAKTIQKCRPKIAFTVYHPGNDWRQILSFMHSLVPEYNYRIKGLSFNANRARPVMIHLWCR